VRLGIKRHETNTFSRHRSDEFADDRCTTPAFNSRNDAEFENSEGQCPTESADASANEAEVKGYRINQLPEKRRSNEVLAELGLRRRVALFAD
jgi:hypothetical protein